jgi:hypothetical protein
LITFLEPDSFRRSRLASLSALFRAACSGLALALCSCLIFFFSASVSFGAIPNLSSRAIVFKIFY